LIKQNALASIQDARANLGKKSGVLTPSPSPSTRPAATIHGGAGLRIGAIVSDEDHFWIVDFDRALHHALIST
jgi:hypothetical protein